MTEKELDQALRSKVPVIWRGRSEYEATVGQVTGIIRRHENGSDILSAEITSIDRAIRSVVICRPEDVSYWSPIGAKEGESR